MATVYTIAAGLSFVDELAAGILDRYGSDPISLAQVTVLLPTRRACRSLSDAFLRLTDGRPLLLPTLSPLGDLDAEGLSLALEELPALAGSLDLPPAINELRRRLLLTRLILAAVGGDRSLAATAPQAVRLAGDLSRLLDQVETERLGFDGLLGLVPEDYAGHWQITLEFLRLLTEGWPPVLEAEGATDAARRRNLVLAAQAEAWRRQPPAGPVIAAGSTGSIPATAELLEVIAGLPGGQLVLPGLDQLACPVTWEAITSDGAHPQHTLARLLARLGVSRAEVRSWRTSVSPPRASRVRLLAEALRPAATTEAWRSLTAIDDQSLLDFSRIDCPTAQDEAEVVALRLRHALETPGRTAALVTPDRTLARRVAMALTRWGILVDDSGGRPLADTAVGRYLRLAANALTEDFAPVALLALLKHPLCAIGISPSDGRRVARALERAVLRGPAPGAGIAGLRAAIEAARKPDDSESRTGHLNKLEAFVLWLGREAARFQVTLSDGRAPLVDLLRAHIAFAEALAATSEVAGSARLWCHDDGEAAAAFINDLLSAAEAFPAVAAFEFPGLLEALFGGRVVRPRFGRHPRLAILGPLEARLQHFDLMVLGGLNERVWPAEPAADPWMSRPMRTAFGLPDSERQIGLSAHDFAQAASAPEVVLTRAQRIEGAPTVPSRWLSRLDTVLRAVGLEGRLERGASHWLAWARALDEPARVCPVASPEPRPPLAVRPRQLSVTEIETWMRDPYAIYARHVLRLRPLDAIAADPGAAERGQFIHTALERFVKEWPRALPADAFEILLAHGRAAFGDLMARPEVWAFWWPRFEAIAGWFIAQERERRCTIATLGIEVGGWQVYDGRSEPFHLTAKADRIDRLPDGRLVVIDYKTGSLPRTGDVLSGLSPQLPLEAAMVEAGGFSGIPAARVAELAFWKLSGGDPPGEVKTLKGDAGALAEQAHGGLEALIWHFDDPATPYRSHPRPRHAPRYDDYGHLARVQEWSAEEGEAEGEDGP